MSANDERVEAACEVMHDAYEKAAVGAGWETNPASRKPWADVPEANKETMRAAVGALLEWIDKGDAVLLSKLLFESRELIEMFSDIVEARTAKTDDWSRRVVREIDAYRDKQGWPQYGFGGEGKTS